IKPNQLGIVEKTIQLIEINCETDDWLNKFSWFAKVSDIHMLGYWEGVMFFFVKQTDNDLLLITPQSVGMVNSKSLFKPEIIAKLLPKYVFDKDFKSYQENKLILEVYPNSDEHQIIHINIFDDKAIAPANAKIGMSYKDVFNNPEIIVDCEAGVRDLSGKTICSFKNIPTIKYVFKPKPDASPIKALKNAELMEFVWLADPTLMEESELPDRSIPEITTATITNNQVDSLETQITRLTNINNSINTLLETLQLKNFEIAMIDFDSTQQTWAQYSDKHCKWYSNFLGVEDDMSVCMEKITKKRADEMEIFLQKLQQLPTVPME
ncbi:MAG: hypothetical protein IMF12_07490, partial [Proteobacteria bacterium]|nr:hypothetical protein [Pseudomonadota bacterium]